MGWFAKDGRDGSCGWYPCVITYCETVSMILEMTLIVQENLPLAVDTLSLVLANDDVTESSAILEDEDGVLLATLNLVVACAATTVVLEDSSASLSQLISKI